MRPCPWRRRVSHAFRALRRRTRTGGEARTRGTGGPRPRRATASQDGPLGVDAGLPCTPWPRDPASGENPVKNGPRGESVGFADSSHSRLVIDQSVRSGSSRGQALRPAGRAAGGAAVAARAAGSAPCALRRLASCQPIVQDRFRRAGRFATLALRLKPARRRAFGGDAPAAGGRRSWGGNDEDPAPAAVLALATVLGASQPFRHRAGWRQHQREFTASPEVLEFLGGADLSPRLRTGSSRPRSASGRSSSRSTWRTWA